MIALVDEFAKLPQSVLYESYAHPASDFEAPDAIAEHARQVGASVGLTYVGRCSARKLMVGDSREYHEVTRRTLYAIAPRGSEREAAGMLAVAISKAHGAGAWWSSGRAVNYLVRDHIAHGIRCAPIDGVAHVLLAAYYFHDPVKVTTDHDAGDEAR